MPRPKNAIRPVEKTINIPETLTAQVDLLLWSPLEEKVPHGAWSKYVIGLIEADLAKRAKPVVDTTRDVWQQAQKGKA